MWKDWVVVVVVVVEKEEEEEEEDKIYVFNSNVWMSTKKRDNVQK